MRFMFFKKLYRTDKRWFYVVSLFVLSQLFIFYKRGVTFAPFYNFGMYSEPILPAEEYHVYQVWVDGQMLNFNNFSPKKAEKILLPVYCFSDQPCKEKFFKDVIVRLLPKAGIHPVEERFLAHKSEADFLNEYRGYLGRTLNVDSQSIEIKNAIYRFRSGRLHFTSYTSLTSAVCP